MVQEAARQLEPVEARLREHAQGLAECMQDVATYRAANAALEQQLQQQATACVLTACCAEAAWHGRWQRGDGQILYSQLPAVTSLLWAFLNCWGHLTQSLQSSHTDGGVWPCWCAGAWTRSGTVLV